MVMLGSLVAGVGHGEAAAPYLLCPVQPAEAVLPQAHPVPAGGQDGSVRVGWPWRPGPPTSRHCSAPQCLSLLPHKLALSPISVTIFPFPICLLVLPEPVPLCPFLILLAEAETSNCHAHCSVPTT